MISSKVTTILLEGWILPVGGVASGRVCAGRGILVGLVQSATVGQFLFSLFYNFFKKYKIYCAYMPCKTMSQLKTLKLNPYDIFDVVLAMSQRCAIFGHSKLALDKSFSYKLDGVGPVDNRPSTD